MLTVSAVSFSYDQKKTLNNINFNLQKGQNLAIIGESGCGKSTLLKLIYGLYDLDNGSIFWNDQEVLGPKFHLVPGMPFMKYLAQDFDLMPFITVAENIGKYLSNFFPEEKKARIAELLEVVEMSAYANTKAKFLSGGQMQRVALAKVLAKEPEVLLLDEPFSHIDNFRKNSLRRRIFKYLKQKEITSIIATHDAHDVLSFCDEVMVVKDGEVITKANTFELYNQPKSFYIASLFGEVNEIEIRGENTLLYPNQLEVENETPLFKVQIVTSYFRGNYYLIESLYNSQTVFFESKMALEPNTIIGLKVKE